MGGGNFSIMSNRKLRIVIYIYFSSLWTLNERNRIRTFGEFDLQRWSHCWNNKKEKNGGAKWTRISQIRVHYLKEKRMRDSSIKKKSNFKFFQLNEPLKWITNRKRLHFIVRLSIFVLSHKILVAVRFILMCLFPFVFLCKESVKLSSFNTKWISRKCSLLCNIFCSHDCWILYF